MIKILGVLLLLFAAPVMAGNVVLSWMLPTGSESCVEDSTVPVLASIEVWQLVHTGGPTDITVTLSGLTPGDYTYISSVTDEAGVVSRVSQQATKTAGDLVVNDDKAYTVVQSGGQFVAFIIGTVPVDTVCDPNSMVKGLFDFLPFTAYGVPVADVTITGDLEPVMVVATCH